MTLLPFAFVYFYSPMQTATQQGAFKPKQLITSSNPEKLHNTVRLVARERAAFLGAVLRTR